MKNIPLQVNIEGQGTKVNTDWLAIMATLKKRGLSQLELESVYCEVNAGMLVTTRGLTLARWVPSESLNGIIKEGSLPSQESPNLVTA
ncbi:hypothetical protein [uncultured Shewanella sp.]|uniref:hypothetical protein n=1 Tax=uncultured Shewanella sp. TaxID=173975 RepID=UPI0026399786|nr:hypothetical protein [uncultured Shewanella sp.]